VPQAPSEVVIPEVRAGSGAMFDRIADRYDALNRIMSLGIDQRWRERTVESLELKSGAKVLDLATGTADLALRIAASDPTVSVCGLDPSEGMLDVGREKVTEAGLAERISLTVGNAEELPFEANAFDATCIAFGIRNVPDRARALREMARVTKPLGRVSILELSEPQSGLLGPIARFHIRSVVPRLGALLSGSREYRYLQESVAAFPQPSVFSTLMQESGLCVRQVLNLTFGVCCLYVAEPAGDP
jgi:demethylmenaquinone methyltransferase/2-methoxy-6-polyprenyl-1,4-benzoquinol methylase